MEATIIDELLLEYLIKGVFISILYFALMWLFSTTLRVYDINDSFILIFRNEEDSLGGKLKVLVTVLSLFDEDILY